MSDRDRAGLSLRGSSPEKPNHLFLGFETYLAILWKTSWFGDDCTGQVTGGIRCQAQIHKEQHGVYGLKNSHQELQHTSSLRFSPLAYLGLPAHAPYLRYLLPPPLPHSWSLLPVSPCFPFLYPSHTLSSQHFYGGHSGYRKIKADRKRRS